MDADAVFKIFMAAALGCLIMLCLFMGTILLDMWGWIDVVKWSGEK